MLGAIIGDISGSRFEWKPNKNKDFELITQIGGCKPTDDSIMTIAIADTILECEGDYNDLGEKVVAHMQAMGRQYPHAGYGGRFGQWIMSDNPEPYGSFGNGSAMRVSPCAYAAKTLEEAIDLSRTVSEVTHNHPEGIKGAEAVTVAIFMALHGKSILDIRDYINKHYYPMDFTLDSIRANYSFDVTCQGLNIVGIVDGPYPFLQVRNMSFGMSVMWFLIVLALSYALAFVMWLCNRKIQKPIKDGRDTC